MLDVKLKLEPGHTGERSWMEPSPLQVLYWNVTYACNFRCGICFTDSGAAAAGELTTREAKEFIHRAHDAGVRDIIVSGGEPFVRPDIVELLAEMASVGMTVRVASNGSLLGPALLDRLRAETTVRSFQISLDTVDRSLYGRIHGTADGMYERVLSALSGIRERGFHTTVSTRLTLATLPGIPALLDRAAEEGWATVTVHIPVHTRRVADSFAQDADALGLLAPVFDHFAGMPERWLVETYIPWAECHPAMRDLAARVRVVHRGCRAGRDRLSIGPTGAISPCICMDVPEAYVGNVREDDVADVFRDSPLCRMLRAPAEHGLCADCARVGECGAGCRASALVLTGRIDGLDLACPLRRAGLPAAEAGEA